MPPKCSINYLFINQAVTGFLQKPVLFLAINLKTFYGNIIQKMSSYFSKIDSKILFGSAAILFSNVVFYYMYYKRKKEWTYVGTLDEICVMPIKAGKPKVVTSAVFTDIGLVSGPFLDREFMLVDEK